MASPKTDRDSLQIPHHAQAPYLHMDSLRLYEMAPVRTHSDLLRTIQKGIDELTALGALSQHGSEWRVGAECVVEQYYYNDSIGRSYKALRFGSWLCLAMALKVTREETRKVLLDALANHPL